MYIGRLSKWGNPFKDGTKEENIANYEKWISSQPKMIEEVKTELKGKILACWCAPKACHGHILARIANNINNNDKVKKRISCNEMESSSLPFFLSLFTF